MPRQLLMVHDDAASTPEPRAPEGYLLTTYRPGDEAEWGPLVSAGQMGDEWPVEKVRQSLTGTEAFDPAGLFFAREASTGTALATACAYPQSSFGRSWPGLHMVAADTRSRGKGLGKLVCQAVLHYWGQRHAPRVTLTTDDWRLAAIAVYLRLGWRAVRVREEGEDHAERWQAAWDKLDAPPEWRQFAAPLV